MMFSAATTTRRFVPEGRAGAPYRTAPALLRRVRRVPGVVALLAGFALLLPAPAEAIDLVSNMNAGTGGRGFTYQAQSFRTGSDAIEYSLTGVRLRFDRASPSPYTVDPPSDPIPDNWNVTVKIRKDANGYPGALVATLTGSAELGVRTFTAPANTTLDADTTYWVSFNEGALDDTVGPSVIASDGESGLPGWTIGNDKKWQWGKSDPWRDNRYSTMMAIRGYARTLSTPANASASAGSGRVTLRWAAVTGAAGYEYQRKTLPAGACGTTGYGPWNPATAGTSHVVTDLSNATRYCFRVRAKHAGHASAASTPVDATPANSTAATQPTVGSFRPADGVSAVAVDANLVLTFNKAVRKGSGDIVIRPAQGPDVTIPVTDSRVSVAGSTVTIDPAADLAEGATYHVRIAAGAFEDLSDNDYAGIADATTWNFTTAATPPAVIRFSPADGATDVAQNAKLVLTFSEPVRKGNGRIIIFGKKRQGQGWRGYTTSDIAAIPVTDSRVRVSGRKVTIDLWYHLGKLDGGYRYHVRIDGSAFEDLAGNAYAGIADATTWNFTAAAADTVAPTVSVYSPAGGAWAVAQNANLVLTFREPVRRGSGNIVLRPTSGPDVSIPVTDSQVSVSGKRVTIDPTDDLAASTAYHVRIAAGAFEDLSGNDYAGIADATTWNFTTNIVGPALRHWTYNPGTFNPADGIHTVAVNANLYLGFTEPVRKGSGNIVFRPASGPDVVIPVGSSQVSVSGDTVTIDPAADLAAVTRYHVLIASGAIEDRSGNDWAGISDPTKMKFTTGAAPDTTAPTASAYGPAGGATAVAAGANLYLYLDEPVRRGSGNIVLRPASGADITIPVTDSRVSVVGRTVTIDPAANLAANTAYHVRIAAGAFEDLSGNDYAGIADATTWSFATGAPDTTSPTVSSFRPVDGATTVARNANLVLTFDEPVRRGSGSIVIRPASGPDITIPVSQVSISGSRVTIDPAADLAGGTAYHVRIAAGAFEDLSGNDYAGIADATTWNFTTPAPTVTCDWCSYSPADGATGVPVGANLVLIFDEPMRKGSGNIVIRPASGPDITIPVTDSRVSVIGYKVIIDPAADLAASTAYHVRIARGALRAHEDWGGGAYAGIDDATTWNFTTAGADTTAPAFRSAAVKGASLVITFSESLAEASSLANSAFTVRKTPAGGSEQGVTLSGSPSINGEVVTLTLATAVSATDTGVKVSYTRPSTGSDNRLKDAADNEVATFADRAVGTGRPLPPTLTGRYRTLEYVDYYHDDPPRQFRPPGNAAWSESFAFGRGDDMLEAFVRLQSNACATGSTLEYGWYKSSALTTRLGRTYRSSFSWGMAVELRSMPREPGEYLALAYCKSGTTWSAAVNLMRGGSVTLVSATGAPTVSSATVNGTALVLTYDEALDTGSVPAASAYRVKVSGGSGAVGAGSGTAPSSVTVSGSAVTLTLGTSVTHGQTVTVSYTKPGTNPVQDGAGNDAAALTDRAVTNTTAAPAPTLESWRPVRSVSDDMGLGFNEPVRKGSGNIVIRPASGSDIVIPVTGSQVSVSGDWVTVNPASDLAERTAYRLLIAAGAFEDLEGNAYAGMDGNTALRFTTATRAPVLTGWSGASGDNVAVDTNLSLFFSGPVRKGSGNIVIRPASGSDIVIPVTDSQVSVRSDGRVVTIDPAADLAGGTALPCADCQWRDREPVGRRLGRHRRRQLLDLHHRRAGHHGAVAVDGDGEWRDPGSDLQRGAGHGLGAGGLGLPGEGVRRLGGRRRRLGDRSVERDGFGLGGDADARDVGDARPDGDGVLHQAGDEPGAGRRGQRRGGAHRPGGDQHQHRRQARTARGRDGGAGRRAGDAVVDGGVRRRCAGELGVPAEVGEPRLRRLDRYGHHVGERPHGDELHGVGPDRRHGIHFPGAGGERERGRPGVGPGVGGAGGGIDAGEARGDGAGGRRSGDAVVDGDCRDHGLAGASAHRRRLGGVDGHRGQRRGDGRPRGDGTRQRDAVRLRGTGGERARCRGGVGRGPGAAGERDGDGAGGAGDAHGDGGRRGGRARVDGADPGPDVAGLGVPAEGGRRRLGGVDTDDPQQRDRGGHPLARPGAHLDGGRARQRHGLRLRGAGGERARSGGGLGAGDGDAGGARERAGEARRRKRDGGQPPGDARLGGDGRSDGVGASAEGAGRGMGPLVCHQSCEPRHGDRCHGAGSDQRRAVHLPGAGGGRERPGAASDAVPATPARTLTKPPRVTDLAARSEGETSVRLTWTRVAAHGDTVEEWQVRRKTTGTYGEWTVMGVSGSSLDWTVEGLTTGTAYTFQVRGRNAAHEGDASNEATATPAATTAPDAVASVSVVHNGSSLTVSWDAPAGATHYDVTYRGGGVNARAAWNRAGTSLTITCDVREGYENQHCVAGATAYTVGVRARNAAGESAWTNSTEVPGPQSVAAPDAVASVSVVHRGASLAVSWAAPARATHYDVTYTDANNISWQRAAWNRAGAGLTITTNVDGTAPVDAAKTYLVGVRARNAGGASGWTSSAPASQAAPATAPDAVASVSVVHQGTSLEVSWDAPARATHYDVGYSGDGGGTWTGAASSRAGTSLTISSGVAGATAYTVRVRARNAAGESAWTSSAATALAAPDRAEIWMAAPGAGRLDVYVVRPARTAGYEARTKTGGGGDCAAGTWGAAAAVSHTHVPEFEADRIAVTGLTGGTAYCVQVRAANANGRKGEWSAAEAAATPESALGVADATAAEGPSTTLDFAVTLAPASSATVTVDYATGKAGDTATAGSDYTATTGTLTFAAGETAKTVSVAIVDDAHDEGSETLTLTLSDASGATLSDAEATGTITNADPLQKDWLARFGRAAAANAIAAVTARLQTPRDAGSHLTVGGQRLTLDGAGHAGATPNLPSTAGPDGPSWPSWSGDPAGDVDRTMSARELLMGTSFRAVLGSGAGAQWTGWGQGASVSAFSSDGPELSLSGETATGSLGMDFERGRLLAGFAMTHSAGRGTAHGAGRSYVMGSAVTTMLSYVRYALTERVSAWGLAGTGAGRLTLDLDGGPSERYGADLAMTLAAMGVRGDLVTPVEASGFALALKADAFWVRTASDAVSTPGVGNLAGARGDASRLRAVLDGSRTFSLSGGATLTPSLELGLRHDGGDAETGTGMELGAGLGYADPSRGLDMALRVHGLAAHAEDGYSEWGVSGSLSLVPGGAGRGLSASLTPSWGVDPGGSERLWALPDASGLAANDDAPLSSRLDAEVGYGLPVFGGGFTGTPHVGFGLSDAERELRLGWRLTPEDGDGFELSLDATRRDGPGETPEHRIGLGITARW